MWIIDQKILFLLVVLSSPALILALHIIFSRFALAIKSRRSPQLICLSSVLFANVPFFALLCALFFYPHAAGEFPLAIISVPSFLYAFIVFNLIGYTYFHFYNMSETARRIRILYDIYSKGSLKKSDIENIYHKSDMVEIRLERLLGLGQIKKIDGAYHLDGRVLYYCAVLLAFWSGLIGLPILPQGYKKNRQS